MNKHFLNKRLAHQLGCAGLVPFVLFAFACWMVSPDWLPAFVNSQQVFGIVILSFLGGIHWGATLVSGDLTAGQTKRALGWGVVPTALGWAATVAGRFDLMVLIAGFLACYQVDKRLYVWYKLPEWFIRLRFILTCVVTVALFITIVAANTRG